MNKEVVVSDFMLMKIPVKECNEKLVSLRAYSKEIVINIDKTSKELENLKDDECFVRESIAIMLSKIQSKLPRGKKIKIIDGYRSLETQRKIYHMVFEEIKAKNPSWDQNMILRETDRWVANPKTIPPHTTGGAVDVTIVDEKGKEMDMGGDMNSIGEESITCCNKISEKAKKNRQMLISIMSDVGFTNYPGEWWHWSYGDRMWAHYASKTHAIYNGV